MRWILLLAALLALAGTLWLLAAPSRPPGEDLPEGSQAPTAPAAGDPAWTRLKTGTLHVRVLARDGTVPLGTQVGFATPQGPRLYYVDGEGLRTLGDIPLGDVTVLVRAPGREPLERRTRVEAGVVGEMRFELPPAAGTARPEGASAPPAPAAGPGSVPGAGPESPAPR